MKIPIVRPKADITGVQTVRLKADGTGVVGHSTVVSAFRRTVAVFLLLICCACEREKRDFNQPPTRSEAGVVSDLVAGAGTPRP